MLAGASTLRATLGQGQPEALLGRPAVQSSYLDGVINAGSDNHILPNRRLV